MKKRVFMLLSTLAVLACLLPAVLAADPAGGACGGEGDDSAVQWSFDNGTLTISGSGPMADYDWDGAPWYALRNQVTSLVIGEGVTYVGEYALGYLNNLSGTLTLPASLTAIGRSAFAYSFLNAPGKVVLPASLESIGDGAFEGCNITFEMAGNNPHYALADGILYTADMACLLSCPTGRAGSVTIPQGVTEIASGAFRMCSRLNGPVSIPASVTVIGSRAFADASVSAFSVDGDNPSYAAYDGMLFDKGLTTLMCCPGGRQTSLSFPDTVTSIGSFSCWGYLPAGQLEVPEGITLIDDYAFNLNAWNADSYRVILPASLAWVGREAISVNADNVQLCFRGDAPQAGSADSAAPSFVNYSGSLSLYYLPDCSGWTTPTWNGYAVQVWEQEEGGFCGGQGDGSNLSWSFSDVTGTLVITGSGPMADYPSAEDAPWHSLRSAIRTIQLPDGLTSVGSYAFCQTAAAYLPELPDGLVSIGSHAFSDNLFGSREGAGFTLPQSLESIGEYAFSNSLVYFSDCQLVIPDRVQVIGDYAFYGHRFFDSTLQLGSSLRTIGAYAFAQSANVISTFIGDLVIPDGVTSIGDYAFHDSGFTGSLSVPGSVRSIGSNAFSNCRFTGSLTLGSGIGEIRDSAFFSCRFTGSLTVPGSVKNIGENAFRLCRFDAALTLEPGIETIGASAFAECDFTGSLTVPGSVTAIGSEAFLSSHFDGSLTVEPGVKEIGTRAFYNNKFTGTLTLGDGLEHIGEQAFWWCSFTGSLTVPGSIQSLEPRAFGLSGFTGSLTLGAGLKEVGESAFSNCGFSGTLHLNEDLERIGANAFLGIEFSGSLVIPDSVTAVGEAAFNQCGFDGDLVLGSGLTQIGEGAFGRCSFTGDLVLGGGLGSLTTELLERMCYPDSQFYGGKPFSGCRGDLVLKEGIFSVEAGLFQDYTGFTGSLRLPDSLTQIGENTFAGCGFSGALVLGSGIGEIGTSAFSGCGFSGVLTLPGSLQAIGDSAFFGCGFSGPLTIPDSVRHIGISAFRNCTSLTGQLDVGQGVTYIGRNAFDGTGLGPVYFSGNAPSAAADSFPQGTQLYAYRSASGWTPPTWNGYDLSYITASFGGTGDPIYIALGTSGSGSSPDPLDNDVAVKRLSIPFHAGLAAKGYEDIRLNIPWGWELFSQPATRSDSYDNRLAIAGLALSGAAEQTSPQYLRTTLSALGFDHSTSYNYDVFQFTPGLVRHMIASKQVRMDGELCTIIAIVCSGTVPSEFEDFITNISAFGFDTAAAGVAANLMLYLHNVYGVSGAEGIQSLNPKFFITGHSLGGAVANLLPRLLMTNIGLEDQYVYTFASPLTTDPVSSLNIYRNVHNILNPEDAIPHLSPRMCSYRFGTDRYYYRAASSTIETRTETAFRLLTGGSHDGKSLKELMSLKPVEVLGALTGVAAFFSLPEQFSKLFAAHDTTTYLALLLSDIPGYDLWEYGIGTTATFQCPVDLSVYNSDGDLVGQTVHNAVNTDVYADVLIQVEETEDGDFVKYVYMPFDDEYTFVVSATDTGTLTYTVEEGGQTSTFAGISLTDGKTFSTQAGGQLPADATQIFVTEGDVFTAEVEHDGRETAVTGDIPVSCITGAPAGFTRGETVTLAGRVHPSAAARKDVTWTLTDAGGTGAVLTGDSLTASAPGTLTLTAAVTGSDYTQTFAVEVWDYPPLMQPYGLKWEGTLARWTALEGAAGYLVQLCRDGTPLGQPVTVGADTTQVDFTQAIGTADGSYTFTVTALGDGRTSSDSEPSYPVEVPCRVEALEVEVSGGAVTVRVLRADVPHGALLIAARYDGGQMTAAAVQADVRTGGSYTLELAGTGGDYRIFLLDARQDPLCSAFRQQL